MYEKIVVPLDGSKLAECVLPHVEEIAKGCSAKDVTLVSVTERLRGRTSTSEVSSNMVPTPSSEMGIAIEHLSVTGEFVHSQIASSGKTTVTMGRQQKQAARYLLRIAKRLEKKGINVQVEVLMGNPAEEIAGFAEGNNTDLIIMASHGRSGPSRWAFGSVADKVFRASCVPVLMIRAPGCIVGI
ncbi:MAG: universal stress protein [Chloroflexota bacterium]